MLSSAVTTGKAASRHCPRQRQLATTGTVRARSSRPLPRAWPRARLARPTGPATGPAARQARSRGLGCRRRRLPVDPLTLALSMKVTDVNCF